jgi:FMN-dependent NADH-azoreductase
MCYGLHWTLAKVENDMKIVTIYNSIPSEQRFSKVTEYVKKFMGFFGISDVGFKFINNTDYL